MGKLVNKQLDRQKKKIGREDFVVNWIEIINILIVIIIITKNISNE